MKGTHHGVLKLAISEGITRGTLNTKYSADFTSVNLINLLHLVRVHAHNTRNLNLLSRPRIVDIRALLQASLVHTHVRELSILALFQLERKTHKRLSLVRKERNRSFIPTTVKSKILDLGRIGEVVADGVNHRLDGRVGEGRAHKDGSKLSREGSAANSSLDFGDGRLLALEVEVGNLVVDVGESLNEDLALLLDELLEVLGDLVGAADLDSGGTFVVDGLTLDDINDTLKVVLGAHGDLDGSGGNLELLVDLLNSLPWVGAHTVHLVDERQTRDVITLHLPIDRLSLRLHTGNSAKNHDGSIKNTERTLNLNREINMSRRINQIDMIRLLLPGIIHNLPIGKCSRRLNSNSLLTLEIHRVHLCADGILATDFVDGVDTTGVEEDTLCTGGLARVDVGGDTDVADVREALGFFGGETVDDALDAADWRGTVQMSVRANFSPRPQGKPTHPPPPPPSPPPPTTSSTPSHPTCPASHHQQPPHSHSSRPQLSLPRSRAKAKLPGEQQASTS